MKAIFVTIFPELIETFFSVGVINKAYKESILEFETINPIKFLEKNERLDNSPYGGGPGMVLMAEPLDNAISSVKSDINIFLTPSGKQLDEDLIQELHSFNSANIICGRYEGFDQRIIDIHSDYEISVGHTVVSGGEVPALFLLEALIRKIPGALGNAESLDVESFTDGKYDHPVYTRPEIYKNIEVPTVLLSGNHKKIEEWKKNNLKDI